MKNNLDQIKTNFSTYLYRGAAVGTFFDVPYVVITSGRDASIIKSKLENFSHTADFEVDLISLSALLIAKFDQIEYSSDKLPKVFVDQVSVITDPSASAVERVKPHILLECSQEIVASHFKKGISTNRNEIKLIAFYNIRDFLKENSEYLKQYISNPYNYVR